MHRFLEGIKRFQHKVFPSWRGRFERLAEGQRPPALFITCSDSRIVPHLVTQTAPGELFVHRNAGNLVPPYESANSGEAATIEYAVQVLKVEEIIVCGHSHCGAITALLNPSSTSELPAVRDWLRHAGQTEELIRSTGAVADQGEDPVTHAIKTNVVVQLEHLKSYPSVGAAHAEGLLTLSGWFYRFETGEVTIFDPATSAFVSMDGKLETFPTVA